MGGHAAMKVKYGFCVLSQDTTVYFPGVVLDPERLGYDDDYYDQLDYWDKIFESTTSQRGLQSIVTDVLEDAFRFTTCNAASYKVDEEYTLEELKATYQVDAKQVPQRAIHGAKSSSYDTYEFHVQYHIGNLLIIDNYANFEEGMGYGAYFDYENNSIDFEMEPEFDVSWVTGYFILN